MPRPTLPKFLERMRTMNVLITQHGEDDLWANMCRMNTLLETQGNVYCEMWNEFINKMFHKNPYDKYSVNDWRGHRVKRIEESKWRDDWSENDADEYMKLLSVSIDLELCNRAFNWENTKNDYADMLHTANSFRSRFDTDEFKCYELFKYNDARKRYEKDDAEYIKEKHKRAYHDEHHITGDSPPQKFSAMLLQIDAEYRTRNTEERKTCEYCILIELRMKEREEAEQKHIAEMEEKNRLWREEKERQRKQEEAQMRRPSRMHSCDDCDYHTTNSSFYDDHIESREHKAVINRKNWFCKECGIQSRSMPEHEFHLKTRKHLKNCGEVSDDEEVKTYECKACEYTTPYKHVYQTHCKSAKHLKRTTA